MPRPARRALESRVTAADPEPPVVTATVKLLEPPAERLSDVGLIEHEAYSGAPLQLSDTLPLNPAAPMSDRL
jgi:hypothetical protein